MTRIARLLHAVVGNRPADLGTKLLNVSSQCPEGICAKRSHDTWEEREKIRRNLGMFEVKAGLELCNSDW